MARSAQWYGWKPDYPDHRDFRFRVDKPAPLPDLVDLRAGMPPVYDQGQLGSCTANAIAAAFDFERHQQGQSFLTPSRLFVYYNERDMEGSVAEDAGAQIRDGVSSVVKQGVCPESEWPYDISQFATKPAADCYTDAATNEAVQYRRISESLQDMLQCLAGGLPFVFGFTVYESFESEAVATSGLLPMPGPSESVLGGHAVVAVGYDLPNKRFLVRNSWNSDWGIGGHFWMPFDYLTDPNLSDDRWCISKVSGETPAPAPAPPAPPEPKPTPTPAPVPPPPISTIPDIPNFAVVDDVQNITRGAQPINLAQWQALKDRGTLHVVKLNTDSESDRVDFIARDLGMDVTNCPITLTQQILTEPDLNSLETAVGFIQQNTFVHCGSLERTRHAMLTGDSSTAGGQDRTGLAIGAYRLKHGWTKAAAYAEMLAHGFHRILFGLDKAWADLPETANAEGK